MLLPCLKTLVSASLREMKIDEKLFNDIAKRMDDSCYEQVTKKFGKEPETDQEREAFLIEYINTDQTDHNQGIREAMYPDVMEQYSVDGGLSEEYHEAFSEYPVQSFEDILSDDFGITVQYKEAGRNVENEVESIAQIMGVKAYGLAEKLNITEDFESKDKSDHAKDVDYLDCEINGQNFHVEAPMRDKSDNEHMLMDRLKGQISAAGLNPDDYDFHINDVTSNYTKDQKETILDNGYDHKPASYETEFNPYRYDNDDHTVKHMLTVRPLTGSQYNGVITVDIPGGNIDYFKGQNPEHVLLDKLAQSSEFKESGINPDFLLIGSRIDSYGDLSDRYVVSREYDQGNDQYTFRVWDAEKVEFCKDARGQEVAFVENSLMDRGFGEQDALEYIDALKNGDIPVGEGKRSIRNTTMKFYDQIKSDLGKGNINSDLSKGDKPISHSDSPDL